VNEPGEVNREPVAEINGDSSNRIIRIQANPGDVIPLDASGSFDPDGDELTFNWFRYNDADSYPGDLTINSPAGDRQQITVPDDLGNANIHMVLELTDNGEPQLVTYRRVILELKK
jgi:hypothetical protein